MITIKKSLAEAMQIMLDTVSWKEHDGIPTGYSQIDHLVRGFRKGSLTILASLPSLGKTAFALNIIGNLMKKTPEIPVLYCSGLGHTELTFRLLTILSGVTYSFDHDLQGNELELLSNTVSAIQKYPLFFEDIEAMDEAFFQKIADFQKENLFGLVIVDPLIPADLSRLKKLARECDVPILAIVSAEEKSGNIPGSESADTVIYLHRERKTVKQGKGAPVSFVVTRNRFGMHGTCRLDFFPQTMQFRETADETEK